MKDLPRSFLNDEDRAAITAAVVAAEKHTAGEIVPMVVSASYHYPMADVIGGVALALPTALLLTPLAGGWLWIGRWNLWVFLGLMTVFFLAAQAFLRRIPRLKRCFIARREIDEEVEEAAITSFFKKGLHRTRGETGVLLFISLFEHRVWILADRGIDRKVGPGHWDELVGDVVQGIRQKRAGEAIAEAVTRIGRLLAEHFPRHEDDRDELTNLIVEDPDVS